MCYQMAQRLPIFVQESSGCVLRRLIEVWGLIEVSKRFHSHFSRFLHTHKKADLADRLKCLILLRNIGRDGVIRTLDPLHPMQVRYRAALRPDSGVETLPMLRKW